MEKDRHKARCNSVYDQNPFLLQDDPDQGLLSTWNKLHFSLRGRRSSKNEPVKLINSSFTVLITPPLKVARVSTLTRVLLLPFLVYQFPAPRRSRKREGNPFANFPPRINQPFTFSKHRSNACRSTIFDSSLLTISIKINCATIKLDDVLPVDRTSVENRLLPRVYRSRTSNNARISKFARNSLQLIPQRGRDRGIVSSCY